MKELSPFQRQDCGKGQIEELFQRNSEHLYHENLNPAMATEMSDLSLHPVSSCHKRKTDFWPPADHRLRVGQNHSVGTKK